MKYIFSFLVFLLLFSILLIVGCQSSVVISDTVTGDVNGTVNSLNNSNVSEIAAPTSCTAQWRCISSTIRAFQNESCKFTIRETCPLSCVMENGTCLKVNCKDGFFCRNSVTRGYQDQYCAWMLEEKCEFGCKKGKCLNATEAGVNTTVKNETEAVKVEEKAPDIYAGVEWLNAGEVVTFSAKGDTNNLTDHTFSIKAIEGGRVIVKVDTFNSDWLEEGDTAKFLGGTVLVDIVEIQFQAFDGGVRKVGYKLSMG